LSEVRPTEIYNLAAQSHVAVSFETPEYTAETGGLGALRILEAIRATNLVSSTKFYQASTSELFGGLDNVPLNEKSAFRPRSPYASAKLYSYWTTVNYREAYGIWAANGILFNHESPRRGETFVTRKITRGLARVKHGLQSHLVLGNLNATRDWGHAKDFVNAMWLMLQQNEPDDFVIATGESHSVREFATLAATEIGIELQWKGSGSEEVALDQNGQTVITLDKGYERPTEVMNLLGDFSKAKKTLNWKPTILFKDLVKEMALHDDLLASQESLRSK
jgi:GDPmannose 4,6-dehydratase